MKHINDLVFTSVQDAKSTLECTLYQNPWQALVDAEAVLNAMAAFQYDQPSRRNMLKTIINKANKALKVQRERNGEVYHHMSYQQRERLKHFASTCARSGDIESLQSTLIMIAHFMRQRVDVPFQEYASQWCAARNNERLIATPAMRALWPAPEERHIADGCSDYQGMGGL